MIDVFTIAGTISLEWSAAAKGLEELSLRLKTTAAALDTTATASGSLSAQLKTLGSTSHSVCATLDSLSSSLTQGTAATMLGMHAAWSAGWSGMQATTQSAVSGINSTVTSGLNSSQSNTTTALGRIGNSLATTMAGVVSSVSSTVGQVKSAFDFKWSLPSLKLPHIRISGGFSLNPISVPSFSISWYKKAMEDGMILNGPTIFGMDGTTLLGGGEAGSETVVGTESLLQMIRQTNDQSETVAVLEDGFERVLSLLGEYLPQCGGGIYLDGRTLVGGIVEEMDRALGRRRA